MKGTCIDGGKLARNDQKLAIYHFVDSQVQKNIFAFCVITFEPIEFQTHSAPQNDRLNLSFVKDKLAENWLEMVEKRQLGWAGRCGYHRH